MAIIPNSQKMENNKEDLAGLINQLRTLETELDKAKSEKSAAGGLGTRLTDMFRCVVYCPMSL